MKEPKPDLASLAMMAPTNPFEILLAADSLEDTELVCLALEKALEADRNGPALDLLIIDMNLPKRSGEEILKCLSCTENYAQTPAIVMIGLIAGATEEKATRYAAMQLGSIVRNVLQNQARGAA
jgi:CheY-like chemotaxis protein